MLIFVKRQGRALPPNPLHLFTKGGRSGRSQRTQPPYALNFGVGGRGQTLRTARPKGARSATAGVGGRSPTERAGLQAHRAGGLDGAGGGTFDESESNIQHISKRTNESGRPTIIKVLYRLHTHNKGGHFFARPTATKKHERTPVPFENFLTFFHIHSSLFHSSIFV